MWLPFARTFDEAYLYMDLRPCPCGESDFERTSTTVLDGREPSVAFSGDCAGCGRHRRFSFQVPDVVPELGVGVRFGGDQPSRLLDAGEWMGVAELFERNARDLVEDAAEPDSVPVDEEQLSYLTEAALAAFDEVVKFLPAGDGPDDLVPEGAFWSQPGRAILELGEQRFTRAELTTERDTRRRELRELTRG